MIIYLLFLFIKLSHLCMASEVWVTSERLTSVQEDKNLVDEFRQKFKDRMVLSAYESQLIQPVPPEQLKNILQQDEEAHQLYLQGKFPELQNQLDGSLPGILELPATAGLENIIFTRLLRRAELADLVDPQGENNFDQWAAAAAWMSRTSDLGHTFSPAVLSKLTSVEKKLNKFEVTIVAPTTALVLIDGKRVVFEDDFFRVKAFEGPHQISVLIPGSRWYLKTVDVSEKNRYFQTEVKPLVAGTCDNPQYLGPFFTKGKKILVAFSSGCERAFDGKLWFSMEGRRMESMGPQPADAAAALSFDEPRRGKSKSFIGTLMRSPWFWTGVGAVAIGGIVYYQNNTESVTTPTRSFR